MKKSLFLFLLFANNLIGQGINNVYSCADQNSEISTDECASNEIDFNKNCIYFRGNNLFDINSSSDKNFHAHNEIHITADFHDKSDNHFTHHYGSSNKADFEIAYMNAWWPNIFIKYDKLEIGSTLPNGVLERVEAFINANINDYQPLNPDPNQINPFLEWEIKVETVFTHLASGFEKTIFGFYFEDFQRDYINEKWDHVATPFIFRTRYAPPHTGKWQARTKITVANGAEIYLSDPYFFEVVEGGQHGFVKVHENKRNLKLDDRMIFPVGHNLAWAGFWHQNDEITNNKTLSEFGHWQLYHNSFEEYKNAGSRFARVHLHNGIMDIEWEYVGNYKNRLHYAWEIDKLVDFWEQNNLLIHFTLMMQHQLAQTDLSRFRLDYNPYSHPDEQIWGPDLPCDPKRGYSYYLDLGITNVVDFIRGETDNEDNLSHKYLKQRLRYLISRYCYSTSISQLDINSEFNNALAFENLEHFNLPPNSSIYYKNSTDTREAIFKYNKTMSEYIKQELKHTEHILSVNYTDWPYKFVNGNGINMMNPDETFSLDNIDVISLNWYSREPNKLYVNEPNNILMQRIYTWQKYGTKPIIVGEVGSEDIGCWSDLREMNIADLMTMGFTGIAGFNTWYGITDSQVFQPVKRTSDHMNGDDVINTLSDGNGEWILNGERNENAFITDNIYQNFYYNSESLEKVVGFVKNNTYNFYNYGLSNCGNILENSNYEEITIRDWQQNDFKIKGLVPNHNYRIHYFSFDDYLESDCFNANSISGNQNLKHPSFDKIIWYVAYLEDCMNGMILANNDLNLHDNQNITNKEAKSEKNAGLQPNDLEIDKYEILPNPVNETFIVRGSSNDNSQFSLYDSQNKLVQKNMLINSMYDINSYKSGVYFIKIESTSRVQFLKFVKL
jgi:hypothetical protein